MYVFAYKLIVPVVPMLPILWSEGGGVCIHHCIMHHLVMQSCCGYTYAPFFLVYEATVSAKTRNQGKGKYRILLK